MGILFLDKSFLVFFILDTVVVVKLSTVVNTSLFNVHSCGSGAVDDVVHITSKRVNLDAVFKDVDTRLNFGDIGVHLLDELLSFVGLVFDFAEDKVRGGLHLV